MKGQAAARGSTRPMFVPFSMTLWILSLGSDAVHLFGLGGTVWKDIALYLMAAGVGAAFPSVLPGWRAYLRLRDTDMASLALHDLWLGGAILLLYCVNVWIRAAAAPDAEMPIWLSLGGLLLVVLSSRQEGRAPNGIDHSPHGMKKSHRAA